MHSQTQNFGRHRLRFGRILGRGMNRQMPVFARKNEGALRLQIEVFLPADF